MGCHGPLIVVDRPGGSGRPLCSPARGRIRQERHQGRKQNPRWHSPSRPPRLRRRWWGERSYPMSQMCSLLPYKDRSRAPRGGPGASVLGGDFSCTYPQSALTGKREFIFCYFSIQSDNMTYMRFRGFLAAASRCRLLHPPPLAPAVRRSRAAPRRTCACKKSIPGPPASPPLSALPSTPSAPWIWAGVHPIRTCGIGLHAARSARCISYRS
jgi:hypothetical protein